MIQSFNNLILRREQMRQNSEEEERRKNKKREQISYALLPFDFANHPNNLFVSPHQRVHQAMVDQSESPLLTEFNTKTTQVQLPFHIYNLYDVFLFPARDGHFIILNYGTAQAYLQSCTGKVRETYSLDIIFKSTTLKIFMMDSQTLTVARMQYNDPNRSKIITSKLIIDQWNPFKNQTFRHFQPLPTRKQQEILIDSSKVSYPTAQQIGKQQKAKKQKSSNHWQVKVLDFLETNTFCVVCANNFYFILSYYRSVIASNFDCEFLTFRTRDGQIKSGTVIKINSHSKVAWINLRPENKDYAKFKTFQLQNQGEKSSCPVKVYGVSEKSYLINFNFLEKEKNSWNRISKIWEIRPNEFYVQFSFLSFMNNISDNQSYSSWILYSNGKVRESGQIILQARPTNFKINEPHMIHFCHPEKMRFNSDYEEQQTACMGINKKFNNHYFVDPETEKIICKQQTSIFGHMPQKQTITFDRRQRIAISQGLGNQNQLQIRTMDLRLQSGVICAFYLLEIVEGCDDDLINEAVSLMRDQAGQI